MPSQPRSIPMVIRVSTEDANVRDALDLIRRLRLFAEEMRNAGLDVAIDGALTVTVKAKPEPEEPEEAGGA